MPSPTNSGKSNGRGAPHNRIQDTASSVMNQTKEAAVAFGNQAENAAHEVGNRLKSLAQSVRSQGPQEGVIGTAASSFASTIETGGDYLQRKNLQGMADDVTDLIRKNPWPAMLVGLGLGYLLARTTSRS